MGTYYETMLVANCTQFAAGALEGFVTWVEGLDENLENNAERLPLPGKIPIWIGGAFRVLASGYWQVADHYLYLAGTPSAGATNVPTMRMRALILIISLEYVARHTDCVDDAMKEKINRLEAKLLTYLPAHESAGFVRDGLYAVCNNSCEPQVVDGIAVTKSGEIFAVRNGARWITLAGEVIELPRNVTIVNWGA